MCDNGECITHHSLVCDGDKHCSDGSDENVEMCQKLNALKHRQVRQVVPTTSPGITAPSTHPGYTISSTFGYEEGSTSISKVSVELQCIWNYINLPIIMTMP